MAQETRPDKPPVETAVPPTGGAPEVALPTGVAPAAAASRMPWYTRIWEGTAALRASRIGMVGFTIVAFWTLVAIFGPQLARYEPGEQVVAPIPKGTTILDLPGGAFPSTKPYRADNPATPEDETIPGYVLANAGPSSSAWLGTDDRGRDVYSRLVIGARQVMTIAPLSILIGAIIGILLGLAAGYYGGWIDEILMRILDAIIAFPIIVVLLMIVSSIGASQKTVIAAIVVASIPGVARLARSLTLDLRTRDYVSAARLRGENAMYIMVREIFPNASGPIIIDLTLRVGYAVFAIATLGFLGLGLPPPTPDWGTMVAEGRNFVATNAWAALFPAAAIATLVVGLNLMADGIRQESARYR
jgi:peptide/nickel transport system permease protein